MAAQEKACKECGYLTTEKECPICNNNQMLEKYKGTVVVLNARDSDVAVKLGIKDNGKFALKYG